MKNVGLYKRGQNSAELNRTVQTLLFAHHSFVVHVQGFFVHDIALRLEEFLFIYRKISTKKDKENKTK